ncbi:DNA topoisomerase III [Thalassotalea crassostreae]|uniref:DNA topoisomerase III n=1 Tax=Thalassotalea crassostreae TaxID=1763536 RepID=UPI000837DEA7|nr:DNA topoisomerase III [Thalassotalea crassostreae]
MKLYIAEKPSLGRAIADALPKPHKKHQGYIEVANGDVVSWCIGHILEQQNPEDYDVEFKKWRMEHLPIVPEQWQLKPKSQTRSQLTVLRKLVKQCDEIVHAGDPDREGQLLVDEVIDFLKVGKGKKQQIKRLLISDLNIAAVKRALNSLKPNSDFIPLSVSALARARADWLYGINLTRAYTIQGQKAGYQGVLSVGRVQTPLLGLVVNRDIEIDNFVSKPFYQVLANLVDENGASFKAKWQPSEACKPYMDDEGRVLNRALAENVVSRIHNQPAAVQSIKHTDKQQNAPLPYNLSALQIDAAKRFSMNAKLVLDVCQALYEKHKLITYPRSDCRYLPNDHFAQAKVIVGQLSQGDKTYSQWAKNADTSLKSKAFNNSKVSAHHAIVPTEKSALKINLNTFEQNIYQLIVRQYLAQFYAAYKYQQSHVEVKIASGLFTAKATTPLQIGWKSLFENKKAHPNTHTNAHTNAKPDSDEFSQQHLPPLVNDQKLQCIEGELLAKETQPPQSFSDATLLAAMTNIARFVDDGDIKKILKDTDGLGTEATRAGIIELLFKRGFLVRQGKQIKSTEIGRSLIIALPAMATKPDMTAQWESSLNSISEQQLNYQSFMRPLTTTIAQMIDNARAQPLTNLPKSTVKPGYKKRKFRKKYNTKKASA